MAEWNEYQERVAEFFRSLGFDADTNVTIEGVRTSHDIDVLVRSSFRSFAITWLVECKLWKRRVPKEKVFALRQIVDDVGADKGLVMSESGYQKGALEAAQRANVQLISLQALRETARYELALARLRQIYAQVETFAERYWALPKSTRIDYGLRQDLRPGGYHGDRVLITVRTCAIRALLHGFPVVYDEVLIPLSNWSHWDNVGSPETSLVFDDPDQFVDHLASKLDELDGKLLLAEASSPPGQR